VNNYYMSVQNEGSKVSVVAGLAGENSGGRVTKAHDGFWESTTSQ